MLVKTISSFVIAVAAMLPTPVSAQTSQAKAQTFALGVNSGFASTQAHEPHNLVVTTHQSACTYDQSYRLFGEAAKDAGKLVDGLNQQGIILDSPPSNWTGTCHPSPDPNAVEAWRTATQVKLSRQDGVLGQIYGLGVNIGIAEAQASLGDSRRQTVYMALQNALPFAKGLGLDVTTLNECILLASGTTPMAEIHSRILLVRTTYQAMM